ncbi:hypothetical protein [Variovorax sp. OK605]|uniref:hypothetical protein n=1 Tax=Variovorax sp. OK605 TaxID=1855317 RepID=UPI001160280A|nr:hypothetical protein [Variovorax sp. OK605]
MKAEVSARRVKGRIQPWNRQAALVVGHLTTTLKEAHDERKVVVLSVNGGDKGNLQLFEPRLICAGGSELKFTGYERVEYCWVIQEWVCELQYEPPVSDAVIRTRYGLPAIPLPR